MTGLRPFSAVKGVDAVAALGVAGMSDMNKLTEWIAESHLDPNDPSNAELMYLLRVSLTFAEHWFGRDHIAEELCNMRPGSV